MVKLFTKSLRISLLFVGFVFFSNDISAQRTVTGIVTDRETNETVIGASVVLTTDKNVGTITDIDGSFSLKVPADATSLSIMYTGYENKVVDIAKTDIINVSLSQGELLADVVIVGYGTVKREDLTGSIQTVTSDKFNKGAITSPQELLAGKVAGVSITTDGTPGGGSTIRIRGESSISASNAPLIVIDGIPVDNSGVGGNRNVLNIINPNDIESFTVLKDASAAAIYGNRASGGVILITTKKGQLGKKISISYGGNVSVGETRNRLDILDAAAFKAALKSQVELKKAPASSLDLLGDADTDWQNEIYQKAIGHDHNLTFAGGIGVVPYRLSLGYTDKNGLLKADNFNRKTVGLNLTPGFLDNTLQVKIHAKAMLNDNRFADQGAIGNAIRFDPTQAVYDPTSKYGEYTTWTIANGNPNLLAPTNPLALLNQRVDISSVNQYLGNITIDYRLPFFKDLRANLNLGIDRSTGEGTIVVPNIAAFAFDDLLGGGVNNSYSSERNNTLLEFFMNYTKKISKHDIDLMGGYSWQKFDYFGTDKRNNIAGTKNDDRPNTSGELFLLSLFTRLNYSYGPLLATVSLRNDHTSRFGPKARSGIFPAAALAYKLFDNDRKYLNSAKLRLGFGVTGQERVRPNDNPFYIHLGTYLASNVGADYQLGNDFYTTLRPNAYNELIKWEENTTYNAAVDFSAIKNRLGGTIEYYQRYAKDALAYVNLPALANLSNYGDINLGNMESRGIEFSINATPVLTKNIEWNIAANTAFNKAEVTDFPTDIYIGGIAGGVGSNIQILSQGYQPYSFYVNKQLYDEQGKLLEGKFEDINNDGKVNADDRYIYQSRAPRQTYGLTTNFRWKKLDFSLAGRSYQGNYMYNNIETDGGYLERLYQSTGYLSNVPSSAVELGVQLQSSLTYSDAFVENASFVRIDHMTLGYNFENLVGKSLRMYATAQNPAVFTKYSGLDPEEFDGIDNNTYPRPRTYVVGVNVQF
jgi:TonB-dependent starch-binding outer membrane protein SusC